MKKRARAAWKARDPPARPAEYRAVRSIVRKLVPELRANGARAVLLAGSWARGDARRESDIDLWVLGARSGEEERWHAPFVLSLLYTNARAERAKLTNPRHIGGAVPGWRVAVPVFDPYRTARRIQTEAQRFRWNAVAASCDRWVGREMGRWAEEVVKLVRALGAGQDATAAVQRNLIADALGFVMATHQRKFWDSENESWERIGRAVGGPWARAQRAALGIPGGRLVPSCAAALRLYALTARAVAPTLSPNDREIAAHACRTAGMPEPPASR